MQVDKGGDGVIISEKKGMIFDVWSNSSVVAAFDDDGIMMSQATMHERGEVRLSSMDGREYRIPVEDAMKFRVGQCVKFSVEVCE